jgi:hypothetical protein
MLESILIIIGVIIIIIGIGKEVAVMCKYIAGTYISRRQIGKPGIAHFKYMLRLVIQIPAQLIAKIGICFTIANYFNRIINPDGSMICSNNQPDFM